MHHYVNEVKFCKSVVMTCSRQLSTCAAAGTLLHVSRQIVGNKWHCYACFQTKVMMLLTYMRNQSYMYDTYVYVSVLKYCLLNFDWSIYMGNHWYLFVFLHNLETYILHLKMYRLVLLNFLFLVCLSRLTWTILYKISFMQDLFTLRQGEQNRSTFTPQSVMWNG